MASRTPKRDEPILSLSTVVTRPTIKIDGKLYEMRAADEMPWLEFRRHAGVFREASQLMARMEDAPTKAEVDRLHRILPDLVSLLVLDLPRAVLAKLRPEQQLQIVASFSDLLLAKNPRLAAQIKANADRSSTRTGSRSARG
jgi:hypothetical protein